MSTPPRNVPGALGVHEMQALADARAVKLVVTVVIGDATGALAERFTRALREAISAAVSNKLISTTEANELRRCIL